MNFFQLVYAYIKKNSDFSIYDEYAKQWKPYRSIASIHLWKMVD